MGLCFQKKKQRAYSGVEKCCFYKQEKALEGAKDNESTVHKCKNPRKTVDKNRTLNLEKCLDMGPIRGDVNDDLRQIFSKKVQRSV